MAMLRKLTGIVGSVLVFLLFGKSAGGWGGRAFQRWASGGPWRERRLTPRTGTSVPADTQGRPADRQR